jgi:hypothetical protein
MESRRVRGGGRGGAQSEGPWCSNMMATALTAKRRMSAPSSTFILKGPMDTCKRLTEAAGEVGVCVCVEAAGEVGVVIHLPHQRLVELHVAEQHFHESGRELGGEPGDVGVRGGS